MKEQSSLAKRMALLLGVTAAGLVSLLGSGGGELARPFNASCTSGSFRLRAVETQLTGPAGMATSEAPKANVTCEVVRPGVLGDVVSTEPLDGASVDWFVLAGSGTVGGSTIGVGILTGADGIASVPWVLGPAVGAPQRLQARYRPPGGTSDLVVEFNATTTAPLCDASVTGTQQAPFDAERIITLDETWTAATSPHRGGILRVRDGAVLTIEAGARVCVQQLSMEAGGRLVARGQAGARIAFTGTDASQMWAGLYLFPAPFGAHLAAPSVLSFVDIENPRQVLVGGNHPLDISDSRLTRAAQASGSDCSQWSLQLTDSTGGATRVNRVVVDRFGGVRCPALLIGIDSTSAFGSSFTITARILRSAGDAVHVDPTTHPLVFSSCEISGGSADGLVSAQGGTLAPTVGGCNIVGNAGVGIRNDNPFVALAAQGNWWGDAGGAAGPTGDGVSGDVDVSNPSATSMTLGY
jgi:hypothetical protein